MIADVVTYAIAVMVMLLLGDWIQRRSKGK